MDCVDIGYGRIGTLYIPCLYFGRTSRARYNGDVRRAEDNAVGGSCQRSLFLSVPNIPQHHPPLHAQGVVASGRRLRRETAPDGCRGVRHDADRPAAPDRGPAGHVDDHGGADMYACGHGAGIRCHRFQNLEEQQPAADLRRGRPERFARDPDAQQQTVPDSRILQLRESLQILPSGRPARLLFQRRTGFRPVTISRESFSPTTRAYVPKRSGSYVTAKCIMSGC